MITNQTIKIIGRNALMEFWGQKIAVKRLFYIFVVLLSNSNISMDIFLI